MGEMHIKECIIFIDDILIFPRTFDEHVERLEAAQHGLKLKPSKCELLMSSTVYLGHVISQKGIETDPEETSVIKTWQKPKNIKELRQFLGFAGYYRRFVEKFSQIARPLNDLFRGRRHD